MAYQWWHEPEFREQSDDIAAAINNYATQVQKASGAFLNSGKTNGGEVYTPYWIIVKMCYLTTKIDDLNKIVLDTCCGSGNFILEIYRRRFIIAAHSNNVYENIKNIVRNSFALDINSNSIDRARQRIITLFNNITTTLVLHNLLTEQQKNELDTYIAENIQYRVLTDSLYNVPCKFDVIISNPPYNKDMYLDFVEAAYDLLNEDGIGVFITPAKFYAKGGAKNEHFREKIMPHIHNVHVYKNSRDVFEIGELAGVAYYDVYKSQTFNTKLIQCYNMPNNVMADAELYTHTEQPVQFIAKHVLSLIEKCKNISNKPIIQEIEKPYCSVNISVHNHQSDTDVEYISGTGGTAQAQGFVSLSALSRTDAIDQYKVIMSTQQGSGSHSDFDKNGMTQGTKTAKFILPGQVPKNSFAIVAHFSTELAAASYVSYLNSALISFITINSYVGNSTTALESWRNAPALPAGYIFDHIYTNEEIFDIFQLTDEERKLITSVIKPRAKKGI